MQRVEISGSECLEEEGTTLVNYSRALAELTWSSSSLVQYDLAPDLLCSPDLTAVQEVEMTDLIR